MDQVGTVRVGNCGGTREPFGRLEEGKPTIQQLCGLLGTTMLKESYLANTKKAQWLKEVSARELYLRNRVRSSIVKGPKETLAVLEFK